MAMKIICVVILYFIVVIKQISALNSAWHWQCTDTGCKKQQITNLSSSDTILSKAECWTLCSDTIIWPMPTGSIHIGSKFTEVDTNRIVLQELNSTSPAAKLMSQAFEIFLDQKRKESIDANVSDQALGMSVVTYIKKNNHTQLTLTTDESYVLNVSQTKAELIVTIIANTFFGARNGLETLSQLIIYDDLRDRVLTPNNVTINDKPAYKWRGIGLDTSRNYIDIDTIKRTLTGMAASKLNTFHWHLVDSQSFPYVSKSRPEFSKLGAYSPKKIYSDVAVREIIEYARVRGIRVVPELDAPAHAGEGWQNTGAVVCLNQQPWTSYCGEPPCGQINPVAPDVYNILGDLYGDMLDQFGTEIFHMGGDEVNYNCWRSTKNITEYMTNKGWNLNTDGFIQLWTEFQTQAHSKLIEKAGKHVQTILWSSDLTKQDNFGEKFSNQDYVIQMWTSSDDIQIQTLLEKNYTLILSNYDALYLDCGYAGWVSSGNNWCSPYKGWQLVYDNTVGSIAGDKANLILGEEALLWTEEARTTSIDSKLWPRAAALGENLWTDPATSWREAEQRMLIHTERLAALGIETDALQPEWCLQNEGDCPA